MVVTNILDCRFQYRQAGSIADWTENDSKAEIFFPDGTSEVF